MRIARIDRALTRCEAHCGSEEPIDYEVESLLTGSVLILIFSEFETRFRDLILEKCSSVSDESIRKYIEESIRNVLRSIRIDELSGLLGKFGPLHKAEFKRRLDENQKVKTMYESMLADRNQVAHGEGSIATMRDVRQYYEEAHVVLDHFRAALRGEKTVATDGGDQDSRHAVS